MSTNIYMSGFMKKIQVPASEGGEIPKLKVAKQKVAEAILEANRMKIPQFLGLKKPLDLGSVTELPNFRSMLRELLITRTLATNTPSNLQGQKEAVKNLLGTMTLFEQSLAMEEEENAA